MFDETVDTDLTESFKIEEDQFNKFKIVKEDVEKEVEEEIKVKVKTKKITQAKIVARPSTKINQSKKIIKKKIVATKVTSEMASTKKYAYPKDYPEVFKEYDKKSIAVWRQFKSVYKVGETFVFKISYIGVTAGHVSMEIKPLVTLAGKKAFHFKAKLTSADFYKYIYALDDVIESYVATDTFLPIKYSLVQRESGKNVDDLQLFDHEQLKTFIWYKRDKKGKITNRKKSAFIPRFMQDSFSSLFFVRGLPMQIGNIYEFPVVTRGKIWTLKMQVESLEKVKIMGAEIKAIKVRAETRFPGILKKKGEIVFWYSADSDKRLLKFSAKIKIGSIAGELIHYKR